MMSWGSHGPQTSNSYVTAKAITFSTITHMAHNNVPWVHTHSPVPVPHYKPKFTYVTSDPPSLSNGQLSPESVTPTGNYKTCNNTPKWLTYVPIDPYSDQSSLHPSLLESSYSSYYGYFKQGQLTY